MTESNTWTVKLKDPFSERDWFTGLLEGEGSCSRARDNGVCIRITNTDQDIIKACENFLARSSVSYNIVEDKRKPRKCYNIVITEQNNCYILIKTLGSSFQCRKQEFLDKLQLRSEVAPLSSNLSWLAGFIEAEGSIELQRNRNQILPRITIPNTNQMLMQRVALTLRANGVSWISSVRHQDHQRWRPQFVIMISTFRNCHKLLGKLSGMLVSNYYASCTRYVFEFCQLRLLRKRGEPYSERQLEIVRALDIIHSR